MKSYPNSCSILLDLGLSGRENSFIIEEKRKGDVQKTQDEWVIPHWQSERSKISKS